MEIKTEIKSLWKINVVSLVISRQLWELIVGKCMEKIRKRKDDKQDFEGKKSKKKIIVIPNGYNNERKIWK